MFHSTAKMKMENRTVQIPFKRRRTSFRTSSLIRLMQLYSIPRQKEKNEKNIDVLTVSCSSKVFDVLLTASLKK